MTKANRKRLRALVVVLVVLGLGYALSLFMADNPARQGGEAGSSPDGPAASMRKLVSGGFAITSENAKIDISTIKQGCPYKDCIPSIDDPTFESAEEADTWLDENDLVFGISVNGDTRAYSQRVLNTHELVNDTVGGVPVLISFCPLCGTAIAFERTLDGEVVEFGVSGKLVNSNLVMYNRSDNFLWQQQGGEQIVGNDLGRRLVKVPITTTTWEKWKRSHPETLSLARPGGPSSRYDVYPYGDYEESSRIGFGVRHTDTRLHEKAVVYGIIVDDQAAAYSEDFLKERTTFQDSVGSVPVQISRTDAGEVNIVNTQTGEKIVPERGFWFSWVAFYPDTLLDGE